jgi:hypothetical protein
MVVLMVSVRRTPTVIDEGRKRLEHYQRHGPTPYSFWFSKHFPQPAGEKRLV